TGLALDLGGGALGGAKAEADERNLGSIRGPVRLVHLQAAGRELRHGEGVNVHFIDGERTAAIRGVGDESPVRGEPRARRVPPLEGELHWRSPGCWHDEDLGFAR